MRRGHVEVAVFVVKNNPKQAPGPGPRLPAAIGCIKPARPGRAGGFGASLRIFSSTRRPKQKIPSGVPPGPAGAVLVNTFFWKILVTRVNEKISPASGFDHIRRNHRPRKRTIQ
jgi:hypothetical protein